MQSPLDDSFSAGGQSLIAIATGIDPVVNGEALCAVNAPDSGSIVYADTVLEFALTA